jgi:hypothetical protein
MLGFNQRRLSITDFLYFLNSIWRLCYTIKDIGVIGGAILGHSSGDIVLSRAA